MILVESSQTLTQNFKAGSEKSGRPHGNPIFQTNFFSFLKFRIFFKLPAASSDGKKLVYN